MPFLVFMFVSYAFFAYFCIKKPKQKELWDSELIGQEKTTRQAN